MTSLPFARSDFPDGFKFGVATSAYQIEGHAQGGAGPTHWDTFAATPGNVARGEDGARACDHIGRMDEDLDLIAAGNFDVYRFSTSWARVLPEGRGAVNQQGLDFYDRLVDGLLERGVKPALTLYHWELPAALSDKGGWTNREIANWFADYVELVCTRLGDRIWSAAPINEPWCVSWLGHFTGAHAPGRRDIRAAARAMHHVLLSHGRAIEVMRGLGMGTLGAVCNFEYAEPLDTTPESQDAAARYDALYNQFFLSGLFRGTYPDQVLDGLGPHLPQGFDTDFATIGQPLDWLGLNYYTRAVVSTCDAPWPGLALHQGPLPKTDMGWEVYPQGLSHFLRLAHEYAPTLPLYVTENGLARPGIDDDARIAFIAAHLAEVKQALAEGLPVRGYYLWSLLDNYEWALGYDKRFGLIHVDFDSFARRPKRSYTALQQALRHP